MANKNSWRISSKKMKKETGLTDNWKSIIKDKKVILYITSVSSLLNGGIKHIEKIEYVLETFRQQREVVLWWRPHPLEMSTLESMRPELLEKYKKIREKFAKETWGVFDTSSDLHRAIVISDAYYGDWSSVIQLYEKTGKSILIQSDNECKKDFELNILDFVILGNEMWAILADLKILVKINLANGNIEDAICLEKGNILQTGAFYNIVYNQEHLLLIPGRDKEIVIYNLKKKSKSYVPLGETSEKSKYGAIYQNSEKIYLLPWSGKEILQIEKKSKEQYTTRVLKSVGKDLFIDKSIEIDNKYIYAVKRNYNIVYRFDMEKEDLKVFNLGNKEDSFAGIMKVDNHFVIPDFKNNKVILWNEEEKEQEIINIPLENTAEYFTNYSQLIKVRDGILLFPNKKNSVFLIDVKDKAIKKYSSINEEIGFDRVKKINGQIYAYSKESNSFFRINEEKNTVKILKINTDKFDTSKVLSEHNGYFCVKEGNTLNLLNYIRYIEIMDIYLNKETQIDSIGKRVHQAIVVN